MPALMAEMADLSLGPESDSSQRGNHAKSQPGKTDSTPVNSEASVQRNSSSHSDSIPVTLKSSLGAKTQASTMANTVHGQKHDRSVLILYGSETGNSQGIAESLADMLERLHFRSRVSEMDYVELVC